MSFVSLLTDPDRKSLAQGEEVLAACRAEPSRVSELVDCVEGGDPLVRMRALDLLEKLARSDISIVEPVRGVFLGEWHESEIWEDRLAISRALGLFSWSEEELGRVLEILRARVRDEQKFVRAWAMDSFALVALREESVREEAVGYVMEGLGSEAKSVVARARKTAKVLGLTV